MRCKSEFCSICNTSILVDFDTNDNVWVKTYFQSLEEYKELKNNKSIELIGKPHNWKNYYVCPYCYDQLSGKKLLRNANKRLI